MEENVDLLDVEVSARSLLDLIVEVFLGLRGEGAELDGGVDLLVPLLKLLSLLGREAISEKALDKASSGGQVVVVLGVLERNGEDLLRRLMTGQLSSNQAHFCGLLDLFLLDVRHFRHLRHVNLWLVEVRPVQLGQAEAHQVLLVERHEDEADPVENLGDRLNHFCVFFASLC